MQKWHYGLIHFCESVESYFESDCFSELIESVCIIQFFYIYIYKRFHKTKEANYYMHNFFFNYLNA